MRYIEDEARVIWSASDLKAAAECEFAWLRGLDARIGRVPAVDEPEDATRDRAAQLGNVYEQRMLEEYHRRYPGRVREIPTARSSDAEALAAAVAATRAALADPDAAVVYQAAFSDGDFVGFADFLERDPAHIGPDAPWVVQDTKLARRARVTALMQLAAYADQLDRLGARRARHVELLLGDGTVSRHEVDDIVPVFFRRRERIRALIADRAVHDPSAPPLAWGDDRGRLRVAACGRCATCDLEVTAARDLLLVAGMRPLQRERLRAAGIETIDALASAVAAPEKMAWETFENLRTQARLQLGSPAGGVGTDAAVDGAPPPVPTFEVVFPRGLGALPRPDHGDLFFDFEGDPLHTEADRPEVWGIDYLFGWVDTRDTYTALWAHDFTEERAALRTFLDLVAERRRLHPGMHIYHYAPYEPTHLLAMAARYGEGEAEVDALLRDNVFIDLYPIVRRALRVGSRSYSIKKLEPLYMGADVRTSDVQRGDDSIVKYVEARALLDEGHPDRAREIFDDLADYNRYDCVSTRRLRDWLVERARETTLLPAPDPEVDATTYTSPPEADTLRRIAAEAHDAGADEASTMALRLAAAAIDYHPREEKTFWAAHFLRMREPLSVWDDTRDVVAVDPARSRVVEDWGMPEGGRAVRRLVELRGEVAPGTRLRPGGQPFAVYDTPAPYTDPRAHPRWVYAWRTVEVVDELEDGVIVSERAADGQTWPDLPVALAPGAPPRSGAQQGAIQEWARTVTATAPEMPAEPASDLLLRRTPRTLTGSLVRGGGDDVSDITRSILSLDRSYLAVQGPPGTGKTYVGSHVIAKLVLEHGFAVGVVAQSHAVVENLLCRVVEAGVPPELVGKALKGPATGEEPFTVLRRNQLATFAAERKEGFVLGGTAWDLANPDRVARDSLDLVVVEEAGQFSLASTIAVSVAGKRLLMLGDPQQLPQVSQAVHAEPVDTSALGWVMDGAAVIPPERGFFLARTWRMRPELAAAVSRLSYAGELRAHPTSSERSLDGVAPGVVPVPLEHVRNGTQSPEEAEAVVTLVRHLVGRSWTPGADEAPRPLRADDIIVVTPYNAQQLLVEDALTAAGYAETPVGTVDKFQGQQAAVAIVSLAASSGRDAPRGLEFLLLQNRLNVAISRAQHTAFVVHGAGLLDDLPRTPEGVARLSAFARLVDAGDPAPSAPVASALVGALDSD